MRVRAREGPARDFTGGLEVWLTSLSVMAKKRCFIDSSVFLFNYFISSFSSFLCQKGICVEFWRKNAFFRCFFFSRKRYLMTGHSVRAAGPAAAGEARWSSPDSQTSHRPLKGSYSVHTNLDRLLGFFYLIFFLFLLSFL